MEINELDHIKILNTMKKNINIKKNQLLLLFFFIAFLSGILFLYPKWLLKIRATTSGRVLIYNNLDTLGKIKMNLNDSIYKIEVASDSAVTFNITHKIKGNRISIDVNESFINLRDTFSLPWDEGCCICIGIDSPLDSLGRDWQNNSTVINYDNDNYGGLYLKKSQIIIRNHIRLKCSIQQSRVKQFIY